MLQDILNRAMQWMLSTITLIVHHALTQHE